MKTRSSEKSVNKKFEAKPNPIKVKAKDSDEKEDYSEEGSDDDTDDDTDNSVDNSEREEPSKKSSYCYYIFILISTIFAVFAGYYSRQLYSPKLSPNEINSVEIFETEFNLFQQKYSEVLPTSGLKVLKSAVKSVINSKNSSKIGSVSPAVVLLIASEDNQNVLKCVEIDFVETITKAYKEENPIVINGRQTNSRDIVDKFDQNFRDQRKATIIIENIESIDANDVMSLHQFTDHQNAKYKDAIIVMTAIHYQSINLTKTAKSKEMDSIATQILQIKWKNVLPEEQSFALISRLTTSVVTIIGKPTNQFKC